jgi:hypothetical protein
MQRKQTERSLEIFKYISIFHYNFFKTPQWHFSCWQLIIYFKNLPFKVVINCIYKSLNVDSSPCTIFLQYTFQYYPPLRLGPRTMFLYVFPMYPMRVICPVHLVTVKK